MEMQDQQSFEDLKQLAAEARSVPNSSGSDSKPLPQPYLLASQAGAAAMAKRPVYIKGRGHSVSVGTALGSDSGARPRGLPPLRRNISFTFEVCMPEDEAAAGLAGHGQQAATRQHVTAKQQNIVEKVSI